MKDVKKVISMVGLVLWHLLSVAISIVLVVCINLLLGNREVPAILNCIGSVLTAVLWYLGINYYIKKNAQYR